MLIIVLVCNTRDMFKSESYLPILLGWFKNSESYIWTVRLDQRCQTHLALGLDFLQSGVGLDPWTGWLVRGWPCGSNRVCRSVPPTPAPCSIPDPVHMTLVPVNLGHMLHVAPALEKMRCVLGTAQVPGWPWQAPCVVCGACPALTAGPAHAGVKSGPRGSTVGCQRGSAGWIQPIGCLWHAWIRWPLRSFPTAVTDFMRYS